MFFISFSSPKLQNTRKSIEDCQWFTHNRSITSDHSDSKKHALCAYRYGRSHTLKEEKGVE